MLLLGIDIGTSSVKVAVVDSSTQETISSAHYPDTENPIIAIEPGWAEQSPETWWEHMQRAIVLCNAQQKYKPEEIGAIGIAYQMHGLVLIDKNMQALRDSIIWCDSRAVTIGEQAFKSIGEQKSLSHLLNSPGNFTASKLAWVKAHEPRIYEKIDKAILPGDFIAMKLTGNVTTSAAALSEGIFYDFLRDEISADVLRYFDFDTNLFPAIQEVFSIHGLLTSNVAKKLGLKENIPVSYKAGDQPNNALSLNVLNPGEVAATAGTSGVIYGVTDKLTYDQRSRVNTFAHVNYTPAHKRLGVLLCINGTGSLNRWVRDLMGTHFSYQQMNQEALTAPEGSEGLTILPFGNGAERILHNKLIGAQFNNIDFNLHTRAHFLRASQEGIAFAFRYGLDILRETGINPSIIRAGKSNLFLSDLFTTTFVNTTGVPVQLYNNNGSVGAALGAGIGAKVFANPKEAFINTKPIQLIEPAANGLEETYQQWKNLLNKHISV